MKLRSLFGGIAGALLLTAALIPRANATLLVYFNFEDEAPNAVGSLVVDKESDETVPAGGDNPGGGIQHSTLVINYGPAPTAQADFSTTSDASIMGANRSTGDTDVPPTTPGSALLLTTSKNHNGSWIQFPVDATFFQNMSLSLAVNTNGNGFTTEMWQTNTGAGGTFTTFATFTGLTGLDTLSANLPTAANGKTDLVIRIVFSDGQSNGQDQQTIIDNIQLNGTVIPEPATVAGGLLGVLGLCWHQRRRLTGFVRLRRG